MIGKIINGVFQSIEKQTYEVDIKSYGLFALNEKLNNHIFRELLNFYDFEDARKLYVIASLRTMFSDIKNEHLNMSMIQILFLKYTQNVHYPKHYLKFFRENR